MEAECGGVGAEVTMTAGELGVEELQLEVVDEESGYGPGMCIKVEDELEPPCKPPRPSEMACWP